MASPISSDGPRASTVGMISLGCPKNRVDSEIMLGELGSQGHEIVQDLDGAETVIVNTCGFIDEAKEESIEAILDVAARKTAAVESGEGPRKLLVAGCMVNRYGRELREEIPEIDGFVSLDQLREVGSLVQIGGRARRRGPGDPDRPSNGAAGEPPLPGPSHVVFDHTAPRLLTTRGFAYLKVAEGC
ncbi:MAG: hypothetical protein MI919_31515, partial [Holophagales bacterium]|nr:hypothetical protein [Holophagales bacterium]